MLSSDPTARPDITLGSPSKGGSHLMAFELVYRKHKIDGMGQLETWKYMVNIDEYRVLPSWKHVSASFEGLLEP